MKVGVHMGPLVLNSVCSNLNPLKVLNILNGMRKALIMFSRDLNFGDGKTGIAKWLNMIIKGLRPVQTKSDNFEDNYVRLFILSTFICSFKFSRSL